MPGGEETILVVEDGDAVRELVRRTLVELGYTVVAFAGATAALDWVARAGDELDLLLTDVVMPGLDGQALADAVTHERPDVAVLFMSGYAAGAERLTGRPGMLLQKPFTPADLAVRVRQALSRERAGAAAGPEVT